MPPQSHHLTGLFRRQLQQFADALRRQTPACQFGGLTVDFRRLPLFAILLQSLLDRKSVV